jgi:type I restriction enzyme S subunit
VQSNGHIRKYVRREVVVFRVTTGEFGGLSNMAPGFPVEISDIRIPTIEALYQACRYPDFPLYQAEILDQPSPMTAKMKSKKYRDHTRSDWDRKRVSIMKWCLRLKLAQNWTRFGSILLRTDTKSIVEESKRDDFWGAKPKEDGTLVGMNVLGRLLMELREQLQSENSESLKSVFPPVNVSNFRLLDRPIGAFEFRSELPHEAPPTQPSIFNH